MSSPSGLHAVPVKAAPLAASLAPPPTNAPEVARPEALPTETGRSAPQLEECTLGTGSRVIAARCGTLSVPENWEAPGGRQITLRIAVIPARGKEAEPDPVVPLAGGPGQAMVDVYPPISGVFSRLNQRRDLVLVDQRGTGASNGFSCQPLGDEPAQWLKEPTDDELREQGRECLAAFDGDPRWYTTVEAARDLDRVLAALGYGEANFIGVSYGTRLGLEMLRRYPQRVRTLTLDAVVDRDFLIGASFGADAQRSLDRLFERCAAEASCAEAFPDLEGDFVTLRRRLEGAPRTVTFLHPRTGDPTTVEVGWPLVARILQQLSYVPQGAALIPLLIHDAVERDALDRLAARAVAVVDPVDQTIYQGLFLSVACVEDWPLIQAAGESSPAPSYLGDQFVRTLRVLCPLWPTRPPPPELREPVEEDVPTLLLSGPEDPVTPPVYAQRVAAALPDALAVEVPGGAHGALGTYCVPRLVARFVETGSTAAVAPGTSQSAGVLDASCVDVAGPEPFFTSFAGPAP